jgi:hypothetical protein
LACEEIELTSSLWRSFRKIQRAVNFFSACFQTFLLEEVEDDLKGEKEIWFEEHTKFPGTFKTLIETQRMASKCQYSFFRLRSRMIRLRIRLRSPVKRRPRLGDQNDVRATYQVSLP